VAGLRNVLDTTSSPEVRRQAAKLLAALEPRSRRTLRLVPVLEEAATPGARTLLEALATGNPAAPETIAARSALFFR
jgi:hypothetical protein